MAAGDIALTLTIAAADKASTIITNIAGTLSHLAGGGALGAVVTAAAGAGIALVGIGAKAVSMAGDFQQSMNQLVTSAGESATNLKMVSDGVKQVAIDTGTSLSQLSSAMYYLESSGMHGASGLSALKVAAEGAKSENADLATVSQALSTVMVDYHMNTSTAAATTESATEAMNGLIATVQNGKTNLQDLASSMGAVLPIASALGISFPEVAGAMATMTNAGMSSRQAAMNLAHVLVALQSPSKIAASSMQSVGLSAEQVKNALVHQGLPEALQMIEDAVGKKFPEGSVQYETALKNILGGMTGLKLAAMLTGGSLATTEQNIEKITAAMKGASNGVLGWDIVQSSFNFQLDRAKEAVEVLFVNIGQLLLPVLTRVLASITPMITGFAQFVSGLTSAGSAASGLAPILGLLRGTFGYLWDILSQIGSFLGTLFASAWRSLGTIISEVVRHDLGQFIAGLNGLLFFLDSNLGPALQRLSTLFQTSMQRIAPVMAVAKTAITGVGPAVQNVVATVVPGLLSIWHSVQQQLIPSFLGLWNAIQPLVTLLLQLDLSLAEGDVAIARWLAQSGALKAIWDGVVIGVRLIIAVLSTLYTVIADTLRPVILQLITTFKDQVEPSLLTLWKALQPLAPVFLFIAKAIGGILILALGLLIAAISGVLQALAGLLSGAIRIFGGLVQIISGALTVAAGIFQFFVDLVTGKFDKLGRDLGTIWSGIVLMLTGVGQVIIGIFEGVVDFVVGLIGGFITTIINFFKNMYDALVGHSIIPDLITSIITWWKNLGEFLLTFLADLILFLLKMWITISEQAIRGWTLFFSGIKVLFTLFLPFITGWFASLLVAFVKGLALLTLTMLNGATALMQTFGTTLSAGEHVVLDPLNTLARGIANLFGFGTGAPPSGPLATSATWMTNMLTMFANDLKAGAHLVLDQITLLAAGIANLLGFHSPTAGGLLSASGQWMTQLMQGLVRAIQAGIPPILQQLQLLQAQMTLQVQQIQQQVLSKFQQLATQVTQQMQQLSQNVRASVQQISAALDPLVTRIAQVAAQVQQQVSNLTSQVQNDLDSLMQQFTQFGVSVEQDITTVAQALSNLQDTVQQRVQQMTDLINQLPQTVQSAAQQITQTLASLGQSVQNLANQVTHSMDQISHDIDRASHDVDRGTHSIQQSISQAVDYLNQASDKMATTIQGEANKIADELKSAVTNAVQQAAQIAISGMAQAGQQAVTAFNQAVQAGASMAMSAAESVASSISSMLGHSTPQTGPMANDDVWGQHFIENFASGMQAGLPHLMATTNTIASALAGTLAPVSGSVGSLPSPSGSNQPMIINFNLDGKTIGKTVTTYQQRELRVQGVIRGL